MADLQRATHATLQMLVAELSGLGLTGSEINALGNLADGTGRTVSELGTAVGAKPATLTGILDRLEGRGLVSRGPRAGDRRAVVIELTEAGREAAAQVRKAMRAVERRALAGLPEEDVRAARACWRGWPSHDGRVRATDGRGRAVRASRACVGDVAGGAAIGGRAAVAVVSEGIQRTARYAGAPQKYHATVSRAWVELVGHHVRGRRVR